jgi:hypothetical protein
MELSAFVALACGQPVRRAAETADVSERTVYRRLQDDRFRASLARERARLVEEAIGRLALGMTAAADTLTRGDGLVLLPCTRALRLRSHDHMAGNGSGRKL